MAKILSFFWGSLDERVNLGDYLAIPVLKHFGYEFLDVKKLSDAELSTQSRIVTTIGTIMDRGFKRDYYRGLQAVVWGSGTHEWNGFNQKELKETYDFRAVRGPRTRALFGLDRSIPLGDPALFLPEFFPVDTTKRSGLIGLPHWRNKEFAKSHPAYRGTEFVDIVIKQGDWKPIVERLAKAEFILTNSLHGAIIAQVYGTPWAFCAAEGESISSLFKWLDWFEYLNLDLRVVRTLMEGIAWWDRVGQYGVTPKLDALRAAFPHDLAM